MIVTFSALFLCLLFFIYQFIQMERCGGGDFQPEGGYVFRTGKYSECRMNGSQFGFLFPFCFACNFYCCSRF